MGSCVMRGASSFSVCLTASDIRGAGALRRMAAIASDISPREVPWKGFELCPPWEKARIRRSP